ncbi:acyl-ACP--UDP-N-acetylglucosamine O-acyltransferase [Cohaesibacter celericrescens]|uniref:Acyl-[acyl-carrier-protein]--UDP-N-acetylglucosamine O-acyltransferase n=1 Tax=Cohaesibacter celericrescens TaxID=2067669 RepID=A0A2N5XSM0_9HYPH|nr:acyl-ACP--UDP-N-acetylglucosamine O-acyltransferase [Cohaesibacter celericrescens]PLW77502.1 acyl-[acyl-carrier-protein]--UDP-N-acetylglucosamine O-acyltransferase [Cohaesibacter celericrescens]
MAQIHPTAIVADGACLADDVEVGAYSIIGEKVSIGAGGKIHSHVVIDGNTKIGTNVEIFPFAAVGLVPQDLKFGGEDVGCEIGNHVNIREYVTIHPGTKGGGSITRIGNHCHIMVSAHVAHDCLVGDHVILVNHATLGGHVEVGDHAMVAGMSAVIQFARIGEHAFVGGMTGVENDVIPFGSVLGNRAHLGGLNIVGLKRRGFSRDQIHNLRHAYKILFSDEGTVIEQVEKVAADYSDDVNVMKIVDFIRKDAKKALCTPRKQKD